MNTKTQIGIAHKTTETALKAVIFAVESRWFALPVGAVLKVSLCPPIQNPVEGGLGTINLENETITVIDLEKKFAPQRDDTLNRRYLLLTQTHHHEKLGLVAQSPPSMIEIPLNTIRSLPSVYQQQGDLSFISHLAVLPKANTTDTIDVFLFGVNDLLAPRENIHSPLTKPYSIEPQQQFIRLDIATINVLLPVGCVIKALPFNPEALTPTASENKGILGDYHWQNQTLKLLDLNPLLGYPSLIASDSKQKPLTVLIIQLQKHYGAILLKAVRQLEWYDLRALQPTNEHSLLKGKFDRNTFLLNFTPLAAIFS